MLKRFSKEEKKKKVGVTITDIAREARVSPATVSYILNNKQLNRISEETRKRVLEAARRLNYHPHASARGLVSNKTQSISVAVYDIDYITDLYFSTIFSGISHMVGVYDYNLHFTITNKKAKGGRKNLFFMRKVLERRVDGVIIIDQAISDGDILELKEINIPFVLIDRDIPGQNIYCVLTDNRKGIFEATKHLIKSGHRRIAFVTEPLKFYKIKEMLEGYKTALANHGIQYDRTLVRESVGAEKVTKNSIEELLNLSPKITAIISSSDKIALQILKIIKSLGLKIPEDIALVGYNDEPTIAYTEPHLTTVKVPLQKMGELAGEILLNLINGKEIKNNRVILAPQLIVRESSGRR